MERRRRSRSRSLDAQNDKAAGSRTIKSVCFRLLYPAGFSYTGQVLFTLIHVLDQALYVFRLMGHEFQLIDISVGKDGRHGEVLA